MNEQSSSSTPKKTCIQLIRKERIWAPVMKALRQTLKDLNNLVDLVSLDDDAGGLMQKLKDNNAKWHKSCKDVT